MKVRELMTESPACCDLNANLQEVARMMRDHDCGAIPVIDRNDSNQPHGIITDRDITIRCVAEGKNPQQMKASDIMTQSTITVKADQDVKEATRLMKENQVRRLIVTNGGSSIVGMLAQADVARTGSDRMTGDVVEEISEPSGRSGNSRS